MSFYQELPYPVFVGTGAIRTSGTTADLKSGELGLFNAETYVAVAPGSSASVNPEVLIASGSWHSKDHLTQFIGGLKQSLKSQSFLGKDIIQFEYSNPISLKEDIIQIGWDGVNDCDGLSFECGKSYFYKINVESEDVFRTYSRPLYRFIEVRTDCCEDTDCTDGCDNGVGCKKYSEKLATLINNDPELKYFVSASAVSSDYAAPTEAYTEYSLEVCDNGDVMALAAVQSQYSPLVTRISRVNSISTYQQTKLTGLPTAFSNTLPVLEAVCGTCPASYTPVVARDYYIVRRPLAGTETLVSVANQNTFASAVQTAYSAASSTFLGQNGSVAVIQLGFTAGATVTPLLADSVVFEFAKPASCTPPAASTIAWVAGDTVYKTTRDLCVTINKTCGGTNRLAALQAFYANTPNIVANSLVVSQSGVCSDTYIITQQNNAFLDDDCLASAVPTAKYDDLQSFEGFVWAECPCVTEEAEADGIQCGVRIKGAYIDTKFGDCSFEPTDYYRQRPIRLTASEVDRDGNPCSSAAKVTKLQIGRVSTQSGEWLRRQYLKSLSLEAYGAYSSDPRIREILDVQVLNFIDATKTYKVYYIVYNQNRFKANWSTQHPADKYETIVAFATGVDTTSFEREFGGYFSQFGVTLKERGHLSAAE